MDAHAQTYTALLINLSLPFFPFVWNLFFFFSLYTARATVFYVWLVWVCKFLSIFFCYSKCLFFTPDLSDSFFFSLLCVCVCVLRRWWCRVLYAYIIHALWDVANRNHEVLPRWRWWRKRNNKKYYYYFFQPLLCASVE